jgi:hypothetical protein
MVLYLPYKLILDQETWSPIFSSQDVEIKYPLEDGEYVGENTFSIPFRYHG